MSQPPSVTLIAGPTASGKSALALKMARETGAVIINADSQQLYADLRILTARPSEEDEAQAEHRLYGVADAADAWSVGRWSRAVMAELNQLGDRPAIVVGGTGLYFTALTNGLANIPAVPDEIRNAVAQDFLTLGEAAFRAVLARIDAKAEARIAPGDKQRLVRALEVHQATGRALSSWQEETKPLLPAGGWRAKVMIPSRALLYSRCDARADAMLESGVVAEVSELLRRGLPQSLPAMKSIGVREISAMLQGATSLSETASALKLSTRRYAKRQITWFRNQTQDWPDRSFPTIDDTL